MTDYNKIFPIEKYRYYYWINRMIAQTFYKLFFGYTVEGLENIKDIKESFLILANHCSEIDPPLIGCAIPRPIAYMAKAELFKVPFLNKLIHYNGAYPVNRGSKDSSYIDNTVYALKSGWLVNIFPEGGRNPDGKLLKELKVGAGKILLAHPVPFVPVALLNTQIAWGKGKKLKLFTKLVVKIGKPVMPEEYLPTEDNLSYEEKIEHIKNIYSKKLYDMLPDEQKHI